MTKFPKIIEAGNLELRRQRATFDDARRMFELVDRNRPRLEQWLPWVEEDIKTPEDCYNRMKKAEEKGICMYFIVENDKVLGRIGFVDVNEKLKSLELGYLLDEGSVGKGVVNRAVKLLERAAFENEWEMIRIKCDVLNERSKIAAKRLGYVFEGTLRRDGSYPDGRVHDNLYFSKIRSEWEKEKKKNA